MTSLTDLFGKIEKLDKSLDETIEAVEGLDGMEFVRHPLVTTIYGGEAHNAMLNMQLKQKRKALDEAIGTKNWSMYIWLHERPFRMQAFLELSNFFGFARDAHWKLTRKEYWSLLGEIWQDTEHPHVNLDTWQILWRTTQFGRTGSGARREHYYMSDGERSVLNDLRKHRLQTVYRGYHIPQGADQPLMQGMSWTLDYKKAEWFSTRLKEDGRSSYVAIGQCVPSNIHAYFNGRGESEVVIDPQYVQVLQYVRTFGRGDS